MTIPPLLEELLRAAGPPGGETAVAAIVRREAGALGAEVEGDVLGSTVARVRGSGGGRTLALVAHVDQIGLGVARIDEDGRLRVRALGTWDASAAVGQRFRVLGRSGEVPAVGVRVRGDGPPSWEDIRLDVGVDDASGARELVAPGDAAVPAGPPLELAGGTIASAALDDRLGVYAALETLRELAAQPATWDVVLVASVQEEIGSHAGATAAVARVRPDAVVVVECTYASDAPSGPVPWGEVPLGSGPSVFRGPVVHPRVTDGLLAAGRGSATSVETGDATWSDADDLIAIGGGLAVGLLSIPVRHMHTAAELGRLSDVRAAVELLVAYARSLADDVSFVR